ncbi:hypothetical protein [uncultured Bartonella sp.]|uniref:DUF6950 family protein n=1 Tax=uncultured Bartonella sp. TaxID=104108 RepID=UPI0025D052A6|nr:hypothetical protein [uncultured Bartonella sp.]
MRIKGWEDALASVIEKHASQPLIYGVSDCGQLAADAVLAVTGTDVFSDYRNYKTEVGARRILQKAGCKDLSALFAKFFTPIHPFLAKRGDIGIVEQDGNICAGVFTGTGFACKSETGIFYLGVDAVHQAFSVD